MIRKIKVNKTNEDLVIKTTQPKVLLRLLKGEIVQLEAIVVWGEQYFRDVHVNLPLRLYTKEDCVTLVESLRQMIRTMAKRDPWCIIEYNNLYRAQHARACAGRFMKIVNKPQVTEQMIVQACNLITAEKVMNS